MLIACRAWSSLIINIMFGFVASLCWETIVNAIGSEAIVNAIFLIVSLVVLFWVAIYWNIRKV